MTADSVIASARQGTAIAHGGQGDVRVYAGYAIGTDTFEYYLNRLQVNEAALEAFFAALARKNVAPDAIDEELQSIAKSFVRLQAELRSFSPTDPDVEALRQAALNLVNAGRFEEAEAKLHVAKQRDRAALVAATEVAVSRRSSLVRITSAQAALAETRLDFPAAIRALKEALEYLEDMSVDRVSILQRLSEMERRAGNFQSASKAADDALDATARSAHADAAASLLLKSQAQRELGFYRSATKELERAKDELTRLETPVWSLDQAIAINSAKLLRDKGLVKEAAAAFLALVPEETDSTGSQQQAAQFYHEHGRCLFDLGAWTDARDAFQRSLQLRRNCLPDAHPDTLSVKQDLARAFQMLGASENALEMLTETHASYREILPPNHADLVTSRDNLAGCLLEMGQTQAAKDLYSEAVDAARMTLPPDHPDIAQSLQNLGAACLASGEVAKAQECFLEAQEIWIERDEANHQDAATTLHNLAMTFLILGDLEVARRKCETALSARKEALGPDHSETADSFSLMASILHAQRDYEQAAHFYVEARRRWATSLGEEHDKIAQAEANLARLEIDKGEPEKAETHAREAVRIARLVHNQPHSTTATALNNLGHAAFLAGKTADATAHFQDALAIRNSLHTHAHPETLTVLKNLAVAASQSGDETTADAAKKRAEILTKELSH